MGWWWPVRDHPRVCGEHWSPKSIKTEPPGSSPRVRGTQRHRARDSNRTGIIPACAGNTDHACAPVRDSRDHPRVCGEHSSIVKFCLAKPGSSPRVRGTRSLFSGQFRARGIIPACAGNTSPDASRASSDGDHPRVCGEHQPSQYTILDSSGSSPRVRGTPGHVAPHRFEAGSSPRVRGTHDHGDAFERFGGIIPACAGNTSSSTAKSGKTGDHPRVCGNTL